MKTPLRLGFYYALILIHGIATLAVVLFAGDVNHHARFAIFMSIWWGGIFLVSRANAKKTSLFHFKWMFSMLYYTLIITCGILAFIFIENLVYFLLVVGSIAIGGGYLHGKISYPPVTDN